MKQYEQFKGTVSENFREEMIDFWMEDEGMTRGEALTAYADEDFDRFCELVSDGVRAFKPDLGYSDMSIDGTLCFELIDNNFSIPVKLITVVR